jgi:hypothetical protein
MFKSLEELVKALEAHEQTKAIVPDVNTFFKEQQTTWEQKVDAEKQKGISSKQKANQEAESLRKYKKAFEDNFGFKPEEDDLDTFTQDLSDTLKAVKSGKSGDEVKLTPEFKEVQKQLTKLTKDFQKTTQELDAERKVANDLKAKTNQNVIRTKLMDAFKNEKGESKIYAQDIVVDNLITSGQVKLDDDGTSIVFVKGNDTVEFEDGVKNFLETRKDLIRNNQAGGSGSSGSNNQGGAGHETLEEQRKRLRKLSNASTL